MTLQDWIYLLFSAAIINMIFVVYKIKSYLNSHEKISDFQDLEEFKNMARLQMYLALIQLVILGSMNIIGLYGLITFRIGFMFLIYIDLIVIALGMAFKNIEKKATTLEMEDMMLYDEYSSVCQCWKSKPFPDF